jgi:hypothetical protein
MATKITKKDMFTAIIDLFEGKETERTPMECIDFCKAQIELLSNRSTTAKRKPSKEKVENDAVRELIMAALEGAPDETFNRAELSELIPELEGATANRLAGLMRPLVADGKVYKVPNKDGVRYGYVKPELTIEDSEG